MCRDRLMKRKENNLVVIRERQRRDVMWKDTQTETSSPRGPGSCGGVASGTRVRREVFASEVGLGSSRQLTVAVPGQIPRAGRTGSGVGCSVVPADVHIEGPVTGEAWGRRRGPEFGQTCCNSSPRRLGPALTSPARAAPTGVVASLLLRSSSHQAPRPRPSFEPYFVLPPPSKVPPQMLPSLQGPS